MTRLTLKLKLGGITENMQMVMAHQHCISDGGGGLRFKVGGIKGSG